MTQEPVTEAPPVLPEPQLDRVEERVLGSLIEKGITTPDSYPLTLNALTAACRQKSNRDPVVDIDEQTVASALARLQERGLTRVITGADQRVPKYRHLFAEIYQVRPAPMAVLCELMLRGPQTVGELRSRASRMHPFDERAAVEAALQELAARTPALVVQLPRQPGRKEPRHAHRLVGEPAAPPVSSGPGPRPEAATVAARAEGQRLQSLEEQVTQLREQVEELRRQFDDFRRQFE